MLLIVLAFTFASLALVALYSFSDVLKRNAAAFTFAFDSFLDGFFFDFVAFDFVAFDFFAFAFLDFVGFLGFGLVDFLAVGLAGFLAEPELLEGVFLFFLAGFFLAGFFLVGVFLALGASVAATVFLASISCFFMKFVIEGFSSS